MSGPQFLALYQVLLLVAAEYAVLSRWLIRRHGHAPDAAGHVPLGVHEESVRLLRDRGLPVLPHAVTLTGTGAREDAAAFVAWLAERGEVDARHARRRRWSWRRRADIR